MAHFSLAVVVPPPLLGDGARVDDLETLHAAVAPLLAPWRADEREVPAWDAPCTCLDTARSQAQAQAAKETEARFGTWRQLADEFERTVGAPALSSVVARDLGATPMWSAYARWLDAWHRHIEPRQQCARMADAASVAPAQGCRWCAGTGVDRRTWRSWSEQGAQFDYWTIGARPVELPAAVSEPRLVALAGANAVRADQLSDLIELAPECIPSALLDAEGGWHEAHAGGWGIAHLDPAMRGLTYYAADEAWPPRFRALLGAQARAAMVVLVDAHT